MTKSFLEAEALLYWKIAHDLNRPGLAKHESQEFADEMEGFAMNAQNARLRHMAAASLEALASSIRAEAGPEPFSSAAPVTPLLPSTSRV